MNKEYIMPIGIIAILLFTVMAILKKTGILKDTEEERIKKTNEKLSMEAAKRAFYTPADNEDLQLLSENDAEILIETFNDAFGVFSDNEETLYQLFYSMPTKGYIRAFTHWYKKEESENPDTLMLNNLSKDERENILLMINKKR